MLNPILVETFIASDQSFQENVILIEIYCFNITENLQAPSHNCDGTKLCMG